MGFFKKKSRLLVLLAALSSACATYNNDLNKSYEYNLNKTMDGDLPLPEGNDEIGNEEAFIFANSLREKIINDYSGGSLDKLQNIKRIINEISLFVDEPEKYHQAYLATKLLINNLAELVDSLEDTKKKLSERKFKSSKNRFISNKDNSLIERDINLFIQVAIEIQKEVKRLKDIFAGREI